MTCDIASKIRPDVIRKRVDILVFTASIDENELAVAHDLVVPRVVDSEGVFTGKVIQLYVHVTMTGGKHTRMPQQERTLVAANPRVHKGTHNVRLRWPQTFLAEQSA